MDRVEPQWAPLVAVERTRIVHLAETAGFVVLVCSLLLALFVSRMRLVAICSAAAAGGVWLAAQLLYHRAAKAHAKEATRRKVDDLIHGRGAYRDSPRPPPELIEELIREYDL